MADETKIYQTPDGQTYEVPKSMTIDQFNDYVQKNPPKSTPEPSGEEPYGGWKEFVTSPHGFFREGARDIVQGAKDIFTSGSRLKGAHEAITGIGNVLAPVGIGASIYAPVAGAASLAGGYLLGKGAEAGAGALGASQDVQNLAGDVGNIAGGFAGGSLGVRATPRIGSAIQGGRQGWSQAQRNPINLTRSTVPALVGAYLARKAGLPTELGVGAGAGVASYAPKIEGLVRGATSKLLRPDEPIPPPRIEPPKPKPLTKAELDKAHELGVITGDQYEQKAPITGLSSEDASILRRTREAEAERDAQKAREQEQKQRTKDKTQYRRATGASGPKGLGGEGRSYAQPTMRGPTQQGPLIPRDMPSEEIPEAPEIKPEGIPEGLWRSIGLEGQGIKYGTGKGKGIAPKIGQQGPAYPGAKIGQGPEMEEGQAFHPRDMPVARPGEEIETPEVETEQEPEPQKPDLKKEAQDKIAAAKDAISKEKKPRKPKLGSERGSFSMKPVKDFVNEIAGKLQEQGMTPEHMEHVTPENLNELSQAAGGPKKMSKTQIQRLHEVISSKGRLFHQTDVKNLSSILEHGLKGRELAPPDPPDFYPEEGEIEWDPELESKEEFEAQLKENEKMNVELQQAHEQAMKDWEQEKKDQGVSLARVSTHGTGKGYVTGRPITLEIEREQIPMRSIAESAFRKTRSGDLDKFDLSQLDMLRKESDEALQKYRDHLGELPLGEKFSSSKEFGEARKKFDAEHKDLYEDWEYKKDRYYKNARYMRGKPHRHFEYEERTRGKNVSPGHIRAIHIDKQKLIAQEGPSIAKHRINQIKDMAAKKFIPVFEHEKTKDLRNWQASRSKLPEPYAKGGKIEEPKRALVGEAGPEVVIRPNKDNMLVLKPTFIGLGKGYKVLPPNDTKNQLHLAHVV